MNLILSIIITGIISIFFCNNIKKHKNCYYIAASIIAILTLGFEIYKICTGVKPDPNILITLERTSAKGIISIGFFIIVMYAGA